MYHNKKNTFNERSHHNNNDLSVLETNRDPSTKRKEFSTLKSPSSVFIPKNVVPSAIKKALDLTPKKSYDVFTKTLDVWPFKER